MSAATTWKPCHINDRSTFIPRNAIEKNEEEADHKFVYGGGPAGMGLYSLDTREAFEILDRRLEKRARDSPRPMPPTPCCGLQPNQRQFQQYELDKQSYLDVMASLAFVKARLKEKGPGTDITQEKLIKFLPKDLSSTTDMNWTPYYHPTYWHNNEAVCNAAYYGGTGGADCG